MRTDEPVTIRLADYRPPAFLIDRVELAFDLEDNATVVDASLALRRNPAFAAAGGDAKAPLALDGEALDLQSITIDGWHVADEALSVNEAGLTDGGFHFCNTCFQHPLGIFCCIVFCIF